MKKYAFGVKCLTFVLSVVLLLSVAVSGLGVLFVGSAGMYNFSSFDAWINDNYYDIAETIAYNVVRGVVAENSGSPQWLLEQTGHAYDTETVGSWFNLSGNDWYYIIEDASGKVVCSTQNANVAEPILFEFENLEASYPVIVGYQELSVIDPTEEAWQEGSYDEDKDLEPTEAVAYTVAPALNADIFWDPYTDEGVYVQYEHVGGFNVIVGISKNYLGYRNYSGLPQEFLQWLFAARFTLVAIIAVSFCLFAAAFVFLMIISGKDARTGEASPKALNKLPLDLYLAAGVLGTVAGFFAAYELLEMLFYENNGYNVLVMVLLCGCGIAVVTLDLGFFMALAAQVKVAGCFWWYNSICGRILKWIWKYIRLAVKGIRKLLDMLPLVWEWLAIGAGLAVGTLIASVASCESGTGFPIFVWSLVGIAVIGYGGWCYGNIRKGIRRMKDGDLHEKIDTQYMYGSFEKIAEDLNALTDVVSVAAEKQLKAERMKTELITNVSHDIKTPLTSVINYVDLLQQPHSEEEGQQYLEVLSRQSQQLKKLVEDLMDMSKASTGNMPVSITQLDAVEAVNQALGEFADKLEAARLTPVFRTPDSQLHMLADGKLTWRVLSNLLSNVVKYALPGTRVYLDLLRLNKSVVLSIKNISREELNISAEELTERFVRGDASRNTEGSGLGLNIAQSLMRLQRGSLELTVDGDLFKVTLTFPAE